MPLVMVRYDPVKLGLIADPIDEGLWWGDSSDKFRSFTALIPGIVAEALHVEAVPDAHLSAADVGVHVSQRENGDVGSYGLEITVLANDYELRRLDLDRRRSEISAGVQGAVKACLTRAVGLNVCVWVLLCPGSFEDFMVN